MTSVEANLGYTPCAAVVAANGIPHVSESGSISPNIFEANMTYAISIVVVPVVILALGLLSLFIYHFVCCCCKCNCVKKYFTCVDTVHENEGVSEDRAKKIVMRRRFTIAFFLALISGLVISNNMFVAGNVSITNGVNTVDGVFDFLIAQSNDVIDVTAAIGNSTHTFAQYLEAASNEGCSQTQDVISLANSVSSAANSVSSLLTQVPKTLSSAKTTFQDYAIKRKAQIMNYVYIVCWIFCGVYGFGVFYRSKIYYRIIIALSGVLVLLLTLVCCIEMIVVVSSI